MVDLDGFDLDLDALLESYKFDASWVHDVFDLADLEALRRDVGAALADFTMLWVIDVG